jgi:hypothetical protein
MIDGVTIDNHVLLVALGIDADGKKHVLGVREGAAEKPPHVPHCSPICANEDCAQIGRRSS